MVRAGGQIRDAVDFDGVKRLAHPVDCSVTVVAVHDTLPVISVLISSVAT